MCGKRHSQAVALTCVLSLALSACAPISTKDALDTVRQVKRTVFDRKKPAAIEDLSIECLAKEIDYLEHQVETFGSVVPKQPDIWGEARLTKHRHEFEREIAKRLGEFQETLQAFIRRSDQSFLSMALTLGEVTGNGIAANNQAVSLIQATAPAAPGADPVLGDIQGRSGPLEGRPQDTTLLAVEGKLSIEPTLLNAQMARYLNHLNHLRRINEGDDTADSPGYSLNLVRIPVSILPGHRTRKGYGAEITITAEPHLSDELLSTTFRNLVINDITDQLGLTITKVLEGFDEQAIVDLDARLEALDSVPFGSGSDRMGRRGPTFPRVASQQAQVPPLATGGERIRDKAALVQRYAKDVREEMREKDITSYPELLARSDVASPVREHFNRETLLQFRSQQIRSRRSRLPFPPSQVPDVFGLSGHVLAHVVIDAGYALISHPVNTEVIHLLDVHSFLREELHAAYQFLSLPEGRMLWRHYSNELASAVRGRKRWLEHPPGADNLHEPAIRELRAAFFEDVKRLFRRAKHTTTASLAWAIMVEASLLEKALLEDMERVATQRGGDCHPVPNLRFALPKPRPPRPLDPPGYAAHYAEELGEYQAAAEAFNQYVRTRWPIVVFALDPTAQDQNVADVFSRRRELQLAMAVALAQGNVMPAFAGRFVRRLETDIETIALNRTIVGFSHNNDTFGWRFYPRVQTPPTPGTLGAFAETLLGGPSRESDIRSRELEPGVRECTAIVVMPSFVPYMRFESRGNWFGLTNPRKKELTLRDSMKLSRNYQAIRHSMQSICDGSTYRCADIAGMLRTVDQLEHRLPMQNMLAQVPFENTLGGFEMFNSGITDLAPELIGWYGAPGIDPYGQTSLFLVGNNFSVHETRVIAGGRMVPYRLLSREVMEVSIPGSVQPVDYRQYADKVDVHLATPYGVSSHLLIPLIHDPAASTCRFLWGTRSYPVQVHYTVGDTPDTFKPVGDRATSPAAPRIEIRPPSLAFADTATFNLSIIDEYNDHSVVLNTSAAVTARLDVRTGNYVIDGPAFDTFMKLIPASAVARNRHRAVGPNERAIWRVVGTIKTAGGHEVQITGDLVLEVTLLRDN